MHRLKRKATLDDLDRVPDGRRAEIFGGRLHILPETGGVPARAEHWINLTLAQYEVRMKNGRAIPGGATLIVNLPNRLSFCPDGAYVIGAYPMGDYWDAPPTLAIEVRSPSDYGLTAERAMAVKRAEYYEAGAKVVWDVDVLREVFVRSYRAEAPNTPTVFKRGELAHAEPYLPGWRVAIDDMIEWAYGRRPSALVALMRSSID